MVVVVCRGVVVTPVEIVVVCRGGVVPPVVIIGAAVVVAVVSAVVVVGGVLAVVGYDDLGVPLAAVVMPVVVGEPPAVVSGVVSCIFGSSGVNTWNINTVPTTKSTAAAATSAVCAETGLNRRISTDFFSSISVLNSATFSSLICQIARISLSLFIMYTFLFKIDFEFVSGSEQAGFYHARAHIKSR